VNTTRYFKLGLFILIGLGLLVAGAIALGAGRMFEKSIQIETCFDQSIAGVDVGAPVKYRGVTIGHVASIRFPRDLNATDAGDPFKYIVVEMSDRSESCRRGK
jgi:ABC-type transporter Mla subunit MlaD